MRSSKDLHLAMVLYTAQMHLKSSLDEGVSEDPLHKMIVVGIEGYKKARLFSKEEVSFIVDLGKEDFLKKITTDDKSYVVYALDLLKLACKDYKFIIGGVGRKKLLMGKDTFTMSMLRLRINGDVDRHKELREIIDSSSLCAKMFYHYTQNRINELYKERGYGV